MASRLDQKRHKKLDDQFATKLGELEAIEFLGLCHFCRIDIFEGENHDKPRDFYDLLTDLLNVYGALSLKNKKKIVKMMGEK